MMNLTTQNTRSDLLEQFPLLKGLLIESDHINLDVDGTWTIATDLATVIFNDNQVFAEQYSVIAGGNLRGIPFDKHPLSIAVQALEMARVAVICQALEASSSKV